MSAYAFVAEKARKAFASVARLESALERNPGDKITQLNLPSMRRLAERAREEMERLAAINHIEVCQYRLVPSKGEYGLGHVALSLLQYQNLFSQIYDAFKNGKKVNATIGREAEQESMLDFAYTYTGSLGVALLARSERDFLSGSLDKPIETLYQIMDIGSVDGAKAIADQLGRAVVKRVHDWARANVEGGFSADIQWKRSDGRLMQQMIDCGRLEKIVEYIDKTADEKIVPYSFVGVFVGGDVSSRTFHITEPNKESFSGRMAEDATLPAEIILERTYRVDISILSTYHYATDKTDTRYVLNNLVGPLAPDRDDRVESSVE